MHVTIIDMILGGLGWNATTTGLAPCRTIFSFYHHRIRHFTALRISLLNPARRRNHPCLRTFHHGLPLPSQVH